MTTDISSRFGPPSTIGPDATDLDGIGMFSMDDGETLVIYDRLAVEAWMSSTLAVSLESMR